MKFQRLSDTSATFESADGRRFGSVTGPKEAVDAFYKEEQARQQVMQTNATQLVTGLPLPRLEFNNTDNGPQTAAGGLPGALAHNAGLQAVNAASAHQGGDGLALPSWDGVPTLNVVAGDGLPLPSWDD